MDLRDDSSLKRAIEKVLADPKPQKWVNRLATFLEKVQNADLETRALREFHQLIWEDNDVSDVGMGTVNIRKALDDEEFRRWVAEASLKPLPSGKSDQAAHIQAFYSELLERIKAFADRTPRVKILRVMAAFFPRHFTTIAAHARAIECHRALFGRTPRLTPVKYQIDIADRIEEVLGEVEDEPKALAERMTIPWRLFAEFIQNRSEAAVVEEEVSPGRIHLRPLPAMQRRKGLSSIGGGIATIISSLSFVEDGVSKEELLDHLRTEFPNYRESSLGTLVSILKNEFHVIQQDGDVFSPTTRGAALLEPNDSEELVPVMLTRTLGFDNVLLFLKEQGAANVMDLVDLLKSVNPGWTSDYAPRALIKWLRDFGLVDANGESVYQLTERGSAWAAQIDWEPEKLPRADAQEELPTVVSKALDISSVDFRSLSASIKQGTAFPDSLIQQLHFGLWAHPRRHFAIMAGLSGSGKTLLAKRYAAALIEQFSASPEENLFIQSVQPGWYDPTPLFGYVNPLNAGKYMRPVMLDVLLRAAQNPQQPFVIILDEMNLSHPEQYFAPILSAMESGDELRLHNEGDSFDGVPSAIPFPLNVAFIGTVNMDETTHGISDKVLDRAFTLEFWDIDLETYPNWRSRGLEGDTLKQTRQCLQHLMDALAPVRLHFGWRTVDDVLDYVALAQESCSDFELTTSLDEVIYAKVLPKLRGTETTRLRGAVDEVTAALESFGLERSSAKVAQLRQDMADTGIMRFWR